MNPPAPLIEALGWTLLHFLWQGAVIAAVLWVVLRVSMRRAAPQARYGAAGAALVLMLGATATTFWRQGAARFATTPQSALDRVSAGSPSWRHSAVADPVRSAVGVPAAAPADLPPPGAGAPRPPHTDFVSVLPRLFPWMVGLWVLGSGLLSLRLLRGWWLTRRLHLEAQEQGDVGWTTRFARIRDRLGLSASVRLLSSAGAAVPMVIGWLKPGVLVPAALFAGLPAAHLEAILAHELAHVRRQDYLVNLLQTAVETLLFYHPAVWWVSAQLRIEREHCCDDIASSVCGSPLDYARALAALEEIRGAAPVFGMAANGGSLLRRVRRLIGVQDDSVPAAAWPLGILALAALVAAVPLTLPGLAGQAARSAGSTQRAAGGVAATNTKGTWDLGGGVTLEIKQEIHHATDVSTNALLRWAATEGRPALRHATGVAQDVFAAREPWAVAWAKDRSVLWIATGDLRGWDDPHKDRKPKATRLRILDFSDPGNITDRWMSGAPGNDPAAEPVLPALRGLIDVAPDGREQSRYVQWAIRDTPGADPFASIVILTRSDGGFDVGEVRCDAEHLVAAIAKAAAGRPNLSVMIGGSSVVPYDAVMRAVAACREAGVGFSFTDARHFVSADEGAAAAEVVRGFLSADTLEARLEHVRFPEKVAPLMRNWYETHSTEPVESIRDEIAVSLTKLIHVDGMRFIVVTLQSRPDLKYKFYAVESTPQGLKLDWETAVGWQPMSIDTFRRERPSSPQPFRVHVGPGDYYNGPYSDESRWLSCVLTYPGDDSFKLFGYVERSCPTGAILAHHFAAEKTLSAILAIHGGADGSDPNQVVIDSIVREDWFLKDRPALPAMIHDPDNGAEATKSAIRVRVLDARTEKPVPAIRVVAGVKSQVSQGQEVVNWQPHTVRLGKDGVLDWPLDRAYDEMALRVEADGYAPQVSKWIKKSEGARDLSIHLVEDKGITGSVITPAGEPAVGATVALAMVQRDAVIENGRLRQPSEAAPEKPGDRWRRPVLVRTDEDGRFHLPAESDPTAAVLIVHADGVLEMPLADLKNAPRVTLGAWGRLEGRVQWGDKPGGQEPVSLTIHREVYGYPGVIAQYEKTQSAADGTFVFERVLPSRTSVVFRLRIPRQADGRLADGKFAAEKVPPEQAQLSCPIPAGPNKSGITEINLPGRIAHVAVQPGTTPVLIGGQGRQVKGRLTGRDSWQGVTFHFHPTAPHIGLPGDEEMWKAWSEFQNGPIGSVFFRDGLKVNADGTFEIPGVLPGDYQIFFGRQGEASQVATGQFTVGAETPGVEPEEQDLGEFRAGPGGK